MDLVAFLDDRITEDEITARKANGIVAWLTFRDLSGQMEYTTVAHRHFDCEWVANGSVLEPQDEVEVFYDSRRALVECEAKRVIIAEHFPAHDCRDPDGWEDPFVGCVVLRSFARVYADHPDYRQEWR